MLSERVVGEESLLLRAPYDHVVRPVEHRSRYKGQGSGTNIQGISALYGLIGIIAVVGSQSLDAVRRAGDNRRVWAYL